MTLYFYTSAWTRLSLPPTGLLRLGPVAYRPPTAQHLWISIRKRLSRISCKLFSGVLTVVGPLGLCAPLLPDTGRLFSSRCGWSSLDSRELLESLPKCWVEVFLVRRRRFSIACLCFKAVQHGSPQTILRLSPELAAELLSFVPLGHLAVLARIETLIDARAFKSLGAAPVCASFS